MFPLFLNGLEIFLHNGPDSGLTLYEICIIVLLFADDMASVGHSVDDLQCSLNRLKEYCDQWGLRSERCEEKKSFFAKWVLQRIPKFGFLKMKN